MLSVQSPVASCSRNADSVISGCLTAHGIPNQPGRQLVDVRPRSMQRRLNSLSRSRPTQSSWTVSSPPTASTTTTTAAAAAAATTSTVTATSPHERETSTSSASKTTLSRATSLSRPSTHDGKPLDRKKETPSSTIFGFASSFQSLLQSQAPVSGTHSAYSELLSVSKSSFPPSTLPIPHLKVSDLAPSDSHSLSSSSSLSTTFPDPPAGLDLLSTLAEGMQWESQHDSPASDDNQQQQYMQKAWAEHIFDSLGLTEAGPSRKASIALPTGTKLALTQVPKAESGISASKVTPLKSFECSRHLDTATLTKRTAVFYEHLYQPLCADIFPRAYMYPRIGRKAHMQDPGFAALTLSMSVLGLLRLHPVGPSMCASSTGSAAVADCVSAQMLRPFNMPRLPFRKLKHRYVTEAVEMITEALSLRCLTEGTTSFGERPTLESVMTSFFISIALFALHCTPSAGDQWEQASFFRFSEAVTLAKLMQLDKIGQDALERDSFTSPPEDTAQDVYRRSVSVWLLLVRAEQWWARHDPKYLCQLVTPLPEMVANRSMRKRCLSDSASCAKRVKTDYINCDATHADPLDVLLHLDFPYLHQKLQRDFGHLLSCLAGACYRPSCLDMTPTAAIQLHDALAALQPLSSEASASEIVLLDVARHLLRCRLWIACDSHGFVHADQQGPLRTDLVLHVALDILDLLDDLHNTVLHKGGNMKVAAVVVGGLYEIRAAIAQLSHGRYASDAFLLDEEDYPSNASSPSRPSEAIQDTPMTTTTSIRQGSRSILVDFDHFLTHL